MDTDTIEAIESLRGNIHQFEARSTLRFDALEARFDRLDARFDGLEGRIEQLDARVEGLDARVERLDQRQEQRFEETRRHFDVIAESLRDDIRMIAEGLVALSTRVDQAFRR